MKLVNQHRILRTSQNIIRQARLYISQIGSYFKNYYNKRKGNIFDEYSNYTTIKFRKFKLV